jgi:hypothetical protein
VPLGSHIGHRDQAIKPEVARRKLMEQAGNLAQRVKTDGPFRDVSTRDLVDELSSVAGDVRKHVVRIPMVTQVTLIKPVYRVLSMAEIEALTAVVERVQGRLDVLGLRRLLPLLPNGRLSCSMGERVRTGRAGDIPGEPSGKHH